MAIDLSQGWDSTKSRINSIIDFTKASAGAKQLKASAGNSTSKSINSLNTQLDKIQEQQKRYLRNPPTSFDELLNLIGLINGSGYDTVTYLRTKLIETSVKIEPAVRKILSDEAIHALGCSQQQTFKGFSVSNLNINPLSTLPEGEGIYVPVESLDILNMLKNSTDSSLGKIFYEAVEVSTESGFLRPYGGKEPFPMNKELNQRMDSSNLGRSFYTEFGKYYQGTSGQPLFDFQYTKTNEFGVTQDCYRFALLDKEPLTGDNEQSGNNVGDFLNDYYSTIKLVDSVDIAAAVVNIISGAVSMESNLSDNQITQNQKYYLLLARILGLCFDSKKEIDVSGISKVGELDGVDESFFEFTEVDLRNIDVSVSNIQNKVVEFEDCDNVKLPVDYETIVSQLIDFRKSLSGQTTEQQVNSISAIIDSLYQNPDWKIFLKSLNVELAINKDLLSKIPLAVAATVLSPKVLLPIFVLLKVVESEGISTYNQSVTSGNTFIQSGNTSLGGVNNIVNNSIDFLKLFKTFNIQVVSKIGAIYLKTLYQILEKDIINLLYFVNQDIIKGRILKKYTIITSLLQILNYYLIISQLIDDYRRCKSLVNDILLLLNLISQSAGLTQNDDIPSPLLSLSGLLPGTDPNRSTINTIQFLQELGVPTGPLPDGSVNLMVLAQLAGFKGADKENSENGKVQVTIDAKCAVEPTYCTRFVGKAT